MNMPPTGKQRKIIHVDMDCFYAAVEMRDNPTLATKPVAVGGSADQRGVICTCNYLARQYGVHAAMPTATAYRHCKELIVLPVDMVKYQQVAKRIRAIFHEFTDRVEPLSLDEAYLDVSDAQHCSGSATLIAQAIRQSIFSVEKLTASAGVAPNKFLAKVASDWRKPNGLFVILPDDVDAFVSTLPVDKLWGVGKVTAKKLHDQHLQTCSDLQKLSLPSLMQQFGKLGQTLHQQCRGLDERRVEPNRVRKSLSVEQTLLQDISHHAGCTKVITALYQQLLARIKSSVPDAKIKSQFIKIKFNDFKLTTAEAASGAINLPDYLALFDKAYAEQKRAIRLLGLGVHFASKDDAGSFVQRTLF